jgi:hypothetical protein
MSPQMLGTPTAQERIFGVSKDLQAEAERAGYSSRGSMDVADLAAAEQAQEDLHNDLLYSQYQTGDREFHKNLDANGKPIPRKTYSVDPIHIDHPDAKPVSWDDADMYADLLEGDYQGEELKQVPTNTEHPERPRTVAASYDPVREVMTLVFLDGTYWNYRGVDMDAWIRFRDAQSKWRLLRDEFDINYSHGRANMADVPLDVQLLAYTRARGAGYGKSDRPKLRQTRGLPGIKPIPTGPKAVQPSSLQPKRPK